MVRTGKVNMFALIAIMFLESAAFGADVEINARLDRAQIALDDSVSLKMSVRANGTLSAGRPRFTAPDFEVVNEYTSTFVESYYENGNFGVRNNHELTKVLRPLKTGSLAIRGIEIDVGGKTYKASDLSVQVGPAGAGTAAPKGYGGGGIGLRGAAKEILSKNIFVKAEVDKNKLFKGEQLIVSYYLYRKLRVFNIQVEKYPVLNGFLREDIDIPVMGQRLDSERVVLDGVPYERSLLARYAAYPLQEGKLKIDQMGLKYNYYRNRPDSDEMDDDPFLRFFQQMAPQSGSGQSEPIHVDVLALPDSERPQSFTGAVGDFNVVSAVDKYEVRANEAVTLTVKVEGRGNVAAIGEPKQKWSQDIELYDSKGRASTRKGGVGEKIFEFLLIPRRPGKIQLPRLEFSFFDPSLSKYVVKSTDEIEINVLESASNSGSIANNNPGPIHQQGTKNYIEQPSALLVKLIDFVRREWLTGIDTLTRMLMVIAGILFMWLLLFSSDKRMIKLREWIAQHKSQAMKKFYSYRKWLRLKTSASTMKGSVGKQEIAEKYELLSETLLDSLGRAFPKISVRSLSRPELGSVLINAGKMEPSFWQRIENIFEFADWVRFAGTGSDDAILARDELSKWVAEGQLLADQLEKIAKSNHKKR